MMKKITALLLALALIAATGCASPQQLPERPEPQNSAEAPAPSAAPEPDAPAPDEGEPAAALDGFTWFEADGLALRFQYPADWMAVSAETLEEAGVMEQMQELLNMDESGVRAALQAVAAYLFDFENMTEAFTPNVNLTTSEAAGVNTALLTNPLTVSQLKSEFEAQYAVVFSDFVWITEPHAVQLDNTRYVGCTGQYTLEGLQVAVMQGLFVHDEVMYTFTYSMLAGDMGESAAELLDVMISTATFD